MLIHNFIVMLDHDPKRRKKTGWYQVSKFPHIPQAHPLAASSKWHVSCSKKREHLQARNRIFISRTGHGHIISYSTSNKSVPKQSFHIPNIFIPIISIRFFANHPNPMIHISPAQKSGLREHHAMLLQEVTKATGPQLKWRQKRSNRWKSCQVKFRIIHIYIC
jgi:hypothetical protein